MYYVISEATPRLISWLDDTIYNIITAERLEHQERSHQCLCFFLLSYSKILYQIILTVQVTEVYNYSLVDGHGSRENYVLSVDTSIDTKSARYLLILSIIIFVFVVFPPCLLLLYPVGIFQRLLSKCTSNRFRIILHIFVEKFQSCYRDGLNNAKGIRSFSGFYFLLRLIIYLANIINRSTFHFEMWFVCGFVLSCSGCPSYCTLPSL